MKRQQHFHSRPTVYFYHTQDIQHILWRMHDGEFPPHFLYGAAKLSKLGIDVVWHESRLGLSRWRMMLRNTWKVLTSREHFDAVYATHYRGIEPLIMLRAIGLYRKPIIVWHHQPVVKPRQRWREWLGRVFYRGMDRLIFFSQSLADTALRSPKVKNERVVVGHWGADLDFYDRIKAETVSKGESCGFISTGKELRDMPTLVNAFGQTDEPLRIIVSERMGNIDYREVFSHLDIKPNIHVEYGGGLKPYEISKSVATAQCVVICCQKAKYTVGLTTLVEALALGKPIITTRNSTFPIDVDKQHCGISVAVGDEEGWVTAIKYIASHPDEARRMGMNARRIALDSYNDDICAEQVAGLIRDVIHK